MKDIKNQIESEVILRNQAIMADVRNILSEKTFSHGEKPLAIIKTYGCQMNEHDSEKLQSMLMTMGYEMTEDMKKADLILYNTCCVRENAELKVYGNLGSTKTLKEKNPDLKVVICGCMMQQPHVVEEIRKKYRHVDIIFGTHNTHEFPQMLLESFDSTNTVVDVWDSEGQVIEGLPVERKLDVKAFVNIMYGCNNFCTYCIVPYTRGRERSRKAEDIIQEVTKLAEKGVKEVTLLGQNVNSYGVGLEEEINFAGLLRRVNEIPGILRIRFMTSHPKDISYELIDTMAECEKVCEQLHLPVQSGSNRILEKMNRKYTREYYLDLVKYARKAMPELAISTDMIVGFPGETEEDLKETIELIKEVGYEAAYTFIYSMRTGTPAATFDNQVSEEDKHRRFEEMLKVLNAMVIEKNKAQKDKVVEVLVEGHSKKEKNILTGRTSQFRVVNFEGEESLIGQMVKVRITNPKNFSLDGELV